VVQRPVCTREQFIPGTPSNDEAFKGCDLEQSHKINVLVIFTFLNYSFGSAGIIGISIGNLLSIVTKKQRGKDIKIKTCHLILLRQVGGMSGI
jgi:hypothetical protein